jgi:hypothetical protein
VNGPAENLQRFGFEQPKKVETLEEIIAEMEGEAAKIEKTPADQFQSSTSIRVWRGSKGSRTSSSESNKASFN